MFPKVGPSSSKAAAELGLRDGGPPNMLPNRIHPASPRTLTLVITLAYSSFPTYFVTLVVPVHLVSGLSRLLRLLG